MSYLFHLGLRRADFGKLAMIAIAVSIIDGMQSYYLQQVVINPFQEANALPFSFYQFGFFGYLAYIPLESLINFALLAVLWVCFSVWLGLKRK